MTTHVEYTVERGSGLLADVETYFENRAWHTRRSDCPKPFASGVSRDRLIAIGVEVARWNGLRHIIRDTEGAVVEINVYVTGPYPSRSPIRRERYS
ncbi:hypothetical protein ACQHIV_37670 [Kribbella sp. GL6]|uniref:hypothetical protein n=1 Tax=Kribbella sp. GL6 TaxID=3419765 RepID=UPI003CFEEC02